MDRVKELSAQAAGKGRFEGLWTIRYDNGVVRKVSIDANDVITTLEEGNQPRNLKAKLATNGGEGLVDWGDGSIEKMTLANAKLVIEHFNPKSLYPNGPPTRRAVGVKGMAK